MRSGGAIGHADLYALCTFSLLCEERKMHRDGDLRCTAFLRVKGGFAACSSRVLVVHSIAIEDA
jgi:hypothetical protein